MFYQLSHGLDIRRWVKGVAWTYRLSEEFISSAQRWRLLGFLLAIGRLIRSDDFLEFSFSTIQWRVKLSFMHHLKLSCLIHVVWRFTHCLIFEFLMLSQLLFFEQIVQTLFAAWLFVKIQLLFGISILRKSFLSNVFLSKKWWKIRTLFLVIDVLSGSKTFWNDLWGRSFIHQELQVFRRPFVNVFQQNALLSTFRIQWRKLFMVIYIWLRRFPSIIRLIPCWWWFFCL